MKKTSRSLLAISMAAIMTVFMAGGALAADVATLRDDVVGIDGNLTTAASVTVVENTVTTAIDDLDELGDLDF